MTLDPCLNYKVLISQLGAGSLYKQALKVMDQLDTQLDGLY